jgi:DNA polymerase III sliding clamp (beta) subunit (PCNA family)
MKIDSDYKIELACSVDPMREPLQNILIEDGNAIATNGHILAVVPVVMQDNDNRSFIIPKEVFAFARETQSSKEIIVDCIAEGKLIINGKHEVDSIGIPKQQFPNWKTVLPKNEDKPEYEIAFNFDYLKDMAEILGTPFLKLSFYGKKKAIKIEPYCKPENRKQWQQYGLLMPVTLDKTYSDI